MCRGEGGEEGTEEEDSEEAAENERKGQVRMLFKSAALLHLLSSFFCLPLVQLLV